MYQGDVYQGDGEIDTFFCIKFPLIRVVGGSSGEGRKPVDWFDSVLMQHVDELGNIAAEYYGDYGMERLLEMVNRMTIGKKLI